MSSEIKSIRSFIGAKDYNESQSFYKKWGWSTIPIGAKMTYLNLEGNIGFYLQDYYAKDWVNNSMLFLEVDNLILFQTELLSKKLIESFSSVRISDIKVEDWGKVLFIHDPSGVLWQIGEFIS